jgi:hypothetical protein
MRSRHVADRCRSGAGHGGWTRVGAAARVLTSVSLFGGALLLMMMVGTVLAAEPGPGTADAPGGNQYPAALPPEANRASDRATAAGLREAVTAVGGVLAGLDTSAGSQHTTALPANSEPSGQPASQPPAPNLMALGVRREPMRLAQATIADDAAGGPDGSASRAQGPSGGTLPEASVALAQSQPTGTKERPISVDYVLGPVVTASNKLAREVGSLVPRDTDKPRATRPVAGQQLFITATYIRKTLENNATAVKQAADEAYRLETGSTVPWVRQDLEQSRLWAEDTLRRFEGSISYANDVGAEVAKRADAIRSNADHGQNLTARLRHEREFGKDPTQTAPPPPPSEVAARAQVPSAALMFLLEAYAPDLIDSEMKALDKAVTDNLTAAREHRRDLGKLSAHLDAALDASDKLMVRVRPVADKLEADSQGIAQAVQAAQPELESAKVRLQELKDADTLRELLELKQKKGSLEDGSDTAPPGGTIRQAGGGEPDPATQASATLDQSPAAQPGTVLQGWAGSDLPPATAATITPTAAQVATPTPTVEHAAVELSDAGPTPDAAVTHHVVSNDTGSGGALDALLTDSSADTGSGGQSAVSGVADAGDSTGGDATVGAVLSGSVST